MLNIHPCSLDTISKFITDARRSGLVFSRSTEYFGILLDDNLIGMCGLVRYRNHWKFKNDYIIPEYRRRGFYKQSLTWRFNVARNQGINIIEATCTEMSLPIWLKLGATIAYQYRIYTKVRLVL